MTVETKTTYRVIAYGTANHGFFNQPVFCSTLGYAQGFFQGFVEDPEMDGVVLIEVKHESWRVIREIGTYPVSVIFGPVGNFKVEKAPKLVMV